MLEKAGITCLIRWDSRTKNWQAKRDLNPQPADLESAALPIELLACIRLHLYNDIVLLSTLLEGFGGEFTDRKVLKVEVESWRDSAAGSQL